MVLLTVFNGIIHSCNDLKLEVPPDAVGASSTGMASTALGWMQYPSALRFSGSKVLWGLPPHRPLADL